MRADILREVSMDSSRRWTGALSRIDNADILALPGILKETTSELLCSVRVGERDEGEKRNWHNVRSARRQETSIFREHCHSEM